MRPFHWLTDPVIDWLAISAVFSGTMVALFLDAMARS